MSYPIAVLPLALAAVIACTGEAASTPNVLQALVDGVPAGGVVELPAGRTYRLSSSLVLSRPIIIRGNGATVIAADGSKIAGALIESRGVDGIRLSDLFVDANVDRNGADYGIWITGGGGHHIRNVAIRNTSQACLLFQDATGAIEDNRMDRCGRLLTMAAGGAANNHGIEVVALERPVTNIRIAGNSVTGAYRKCIASYSRGAGSIAHLAVEDNLVSRCGLGGIYLATAPDAKAQRDVALKNNLASESYVNFQIDDVVGLTMQNDRSTATRDRDGKPGGQGVVFVNVDDADVKGLSVTDSGASGILVRDSRRVRLAAPRVTNSNTGDHSFAAAIHLYNVRDSRAENLWLRNSRQGGAKTFGLVETDGSNANAVTITQADGFIERRFP